MSPRYSNVTTSIHGFDYTICITQSQIYLFKPTQRNSKSAPKFLPESHTTRKMAIANMDINSAPRMWCATAI